VGDEARRVRVRGAQALVGAADVRLGVVVAGADARLVRVAYRHVAVRRRHAAPDAEDVAARHARVAQMVDEAVEAPVEELAAPARALELEGGADLAVAVRVADVRGRASETSEAA